MNFKQLKDFDFKNIDIDRNHSRGYYFMCPVLVFGDYKNATFYQD